ncbi:hypothetical protein [Holdemanella biformis]|uniref:hypothetical protein n=1 Tax=Holdemanella biformis TaxID=1735 RepID=UPI00189979C8|nr:hypothetical protein [Holdemanella biformis]
MALNNLKKNLLFSCIENKELVDVMVEDESKSTRKKPSAILELMVLNGLLSENEQIRFWIVNLYRGCSSGTILSSVFDYNSAGVNWKSCNLPLIPFLDFAINEQKFIKKYEVDKEPIYHLLNCMDSIKRILEKLKEDNMDIESNLKYRDALETIDYFIAQLNDEKEEIQFVAYYRFFKKYWNDLKDSTHTFRALCDLATMQQGWRNESESRYALTQCLRDLADSWPKDLED